MDIRKCKHCKVEFDISEKPKCWMASHSRWCSENPKREEYASRGRICNEFMNAARKASGITNQYTKAKLEGREVPVSPMKGKPRNIFR